MSLVKENKTRADTALEQVLDKTVNIQILRRCFWEKNICME